MYLCGAICTNEVAVFCIILVYKLSLITFINKILYLFQFSAIQAVFNNGILKWIV